MIALKAESLGGLIRSATMDLRLPEMWLTIMMNRINPALFSLSARQRSWPSACKRVERHTEIKK